MLTERKSQPGTPSLTLSRIKQQGAGTPSFILPRIKQRGRKQNFPPPFLDMGEGKGGGAGTLTLASVIKHGGSDGK
jgi:hypothetical protein